MSLFESLSSARTPLTIAQTAELLGLHPMTVYKWTRAGKMPSLRLGGTVRIDPADLIVWIKARHLT